MDAKAILDKVRDTWLNLGGNQRRIATFAIIILVVASVYYLATPDKPVRERTQKKTSFDFSQPDMAAEVMAEKLQGNINSLRNQLQATQQRLEQLENTRREAGGPAPVQSSPVMPGSPVAGPRNKPDISEDALLREMNKTIGRSEIVEGGEAPFAPAPVLQLPTPEQAQQLPSGSQEHMQPEQPSRGTTRPSQSPVEDLPPPRSMGVISWAPDRPAEVTAPTNSEQDFEGFYVPSSSFFEVSLLTGLDAPTGTKAKNQPSPLALRVQDLSWLPNEVRQNVRGCFVLAEGIGELSTERVSVRGIFISCVGNDGQQVLDQKLMGYVADSDGKAGMRGQVVSKAGKLLAETMKVGFIQGLSEFFNFNARTLTVTDSGAISSPKSTDFGDAFLGGTSSGISKALDKVASYYMSLAEEVFPVIQVGATRSATFVVTQGTELVFDKKLTRQKKELEHEL